MSLETVLFSLAAAILGMFGVAWLDRESARQREEKFWADLEDDDEAFRWHH
jgi:hypothetical protein